MEGTLLNNLGIDPAYLIFALMAVTLILLVVVIICVIKVRSLYRRYDLFMRGKDAETLEGAIIAMIEELGYLQAEDKANKDMLKVLNKRFKDSYQKTGVVKYNAFKGMGGNLSFVVAMLDDNNTGFVLNNVHSKEGCYLYLKEVDKGETEVILGSEEKEALEQALGYTS